MKILLVHNYYGSAAPSGENKVFEAERAMLEKHGHEVAVYTRHSDEIRVVASGQGLGVRFKKLWGMVKGALCTVGNPFAARSVAKLCQQFKPDVVHCHNTFPLISPLAVRAASKYAPVVMTLHNYRTVCAAGVPTRNGKVCTLCLDKKCVLDGIKHRCYRGSLVATLPLSINIAIYRCVLKKWVGRVIALTDFQKENLIKLNWVPDGIVVKENFVEVLKGSIVPRDNRLKQLLYVGRLSSEKGVKTLLKAWNDRFLDCKLLIVGDGDMKGECESLSKGANVEFLGHRSNHEVRKLMRESLALILPSECWEGLPVTLLESLSEGTPVIVSNLGPLPGLIKMSRFGEVFEAGNSEACAAAIVRLLNRPDYDEMCAVAKREAKAKYSEESNYGQLMKIYEGAF